MLGDIMGDVLTMLQSPSRTASQYQWQVFRRMVTFFPTIHAGTIHHHCVVQHRPSTLFGSLQKLKKARQPRDMKRIDLRQLCQHPRVAPVVLMIGGNIPGQTQVLSTLIYGHVEAMDYAQAHVLAGGMAVLAFAALLGLAWIRRRSEGRAP